MLTNHACTLRCWRLWLFSPFGQPVDQTGLPGLYDVSFSISQETFRLKAPVEVIVSELEAQLGLTLKATSLVLRTLIIESARRPREE
ncbi:MAG TPA: DUF3738 domain-containing protein [Vicinamibacterales bacterium]|nr:DUF3738 domain-containing protein [Vicinamibacterales bacterium]